jgi:hypothetical protein
MLDGRWMEVSKKTQLKVQWTGFFGFIVCRAYFWMALLGLKPQTRDATELASLSLGLVFVPPPNLTWSLFTPATTYLRLHGLPSIK